MRRHRILDGATTKTMDAWCEVILMFVRAEKRHQEVPFFCVRQNIKLLVGFRLLAAWTNMFVQKIQHPIGKIDLIYQQVITMAFASINFHFN